MSLPVDGNALGEHPIIVRLIKGMYYVGPPEPRYKFTWDVNILLAFLEAWFPLSSLDMKQLTFKTVALSSLNFCSTKPDVSSFGCWPYEIR